MCQAPFIIPGAMKLANTGTVTGIRLFQRLSLLVCTVLFAFPVTDRAQDMVRPSTSTAPVVVTSEGVSSAYGAPAAFSRSRFANLTNAYVLPPYSVYAGLIYEGDALRYEHPDHLFTEEIEVGLPHRFGVAVENEVEAFRGHVQDNSLSVELRYALADWDKIPLNPTLFAEYRFGIGHIFHDEGIPMRLDKGEGATEADQTSAHTPDAIELRLLLAEDFCDKVEWAFNFFFEQEDEGDHGREWGFAPECAGAAFPAGGTPEARPGNAVPQFHG